MIQAIDAVAGGDMLKWDIVTDMNVVEFLNRLSYLKEKSDLNAN